MAEKAPSPPPSEYDYFHCTPCQTRQQEAPESDYALQQIRSFGRRRWEATRHGAAAGEAGRPISADWTIDQGWDSYTAEEHGIWNTLYERQSKLLPGRACDEFIQGMRDLPSMPSTSPTSAA